MKKIRYILLYISLICFSCHEEENIRDDLLMGNEKQIIQDIQEDILLGKFVCRNGRFVHLMQRELNQDEKNSFSISVRWVFADNGVLTHLLNFLGEKYVSIAVDMRLGNRDYPDWEDKGAYYDPMLLTIFFHQGDISPVCIQEEFLHYVQHNIYHYDMTAEYKRSIEFEVAMMIDIVNAIDTRRVPEKLYVDLENGMGDYRNMLQSFAERWCWSKDSVIEKFGEWMIGKVIIPKVVYILLCYWIGCINY